MLQAYNDYRTLILDPGIHILYLKHRFMHTLWLLELPGLNPGAFRSQLRCATRL